MTKELVFLWKPYEEDLPSKVYDELEEMTVFTPEGCDQYQDFSWDNEDNELYSEIAKYVSEKYSLYFFFIDFHSGREFND